MKNKLLITLLIGVMIFTAGCSKKQDDKGNTAPENVDVKQLEVIEPKELPEEEPKELSVKTGVYKMEYKEELEGVEYTFSSYIIFNEDNTGYYSANDVCPMTWDENGFSVEGSEDYQYTVTSENTIELIRVDAPNEEYTYTGTEIPEELLSILDANLDEETKQYNKDAVEEFEYIIGSDTIRFYDGEGKVSYEASGTDLNTVTAAYYEVTDLRMPILYVSTPNAAHYAGYQHLLQYKDGAVNDIAGLDEFIELYPKSGVTVATWQGGGYGEINYYYFAPNEDNEITFSAYRTEMTDEEYKGAYKQQFGTEYENIYQINDETVDKEAFESWLNETTGGETPVSPIEYKPLGAVFR